MYKINLTQPCHIFVLVKFCNFPTFTRISLENVCIVLLIKSLLPSSIVYALFDWKTLANELKLYPYYYAETTVVWGITGAFVSVVSTPRLLAAGERLLGSLRSVKLLCFGLDIRFCLGGMFEVHYMFCIIPTLYPLLNGLTISILFVICIWDSD